MVDYMNDSLASLKAAILADGVIDDDEVALLRARLYADGVIDREEADFLFDLNDAAGGEGSASSWEAFFVEAIAGHVLGDDRSPGDVDDEEAAWLVRRVQGDGIVDGCERRLLEAILAKSRSAPDSLRELLS